jgi:hypothetical protein
MIDRETARNMYSSIPKINLKNYCISLVLLQELQIPAAIIETNRKASFNPLKETFDCQTAAQLRGS